MCTIDPQPGKVPKLGAKAAYVVARVKCGLATSTSSSCQEKSQLRTAVPDRIASARDTSEYNGQSRHLEARLDLIPWYRV